MPEAGFLADILEHPEDDTPRLVYADWLDDHGQPERAEFIRAQVRAERTPGAEGLNETAQRLWEQHRVAWFGPDAAGWDFDACHRGFLNAPYASDWARAVRVAGRSTQAWPLGPVTRIQLGHAPGEDEYGPDGADPEMLRHLPGLASWGGLQLWKYNPGNSDQDRLLTLLRSPHLTGLAEFDAINWVVGDDGI